MEIYKSVHKRKNIHSRMCICNYITGHNNLLHNSQLKSYISGTNCVPLNFRLSKIWYVKVLRIKKRFVFLR